MDKLDYVKYMNLKAFRSNAPKVQDKEAKDQISKIQVGGLFSNVQLFPARHYKLLGLCTMSPSSNESLTMWTAYAFEQRLLGRRSDDIAAL